MGAKLSRLVDSLSRKTRRSSSGVDVESSGVTPSGSFETGHDPAVHGAKLEDRNYNNEAYKKKPADPHELQQKAAASTTIQTQFRQQQSKEEVQAMREEDAAIRIQSAYRGFVDREKVREMKGPGQPAKSEVEEIDIDLTDPEVEKAAIKLQAACKGFKARKQLAESKQDNTAVKTATDIQRDEDRNGSLTDSEAHQAAMKIQAGVRGYITRKELKEKTLKNTTEETDECQDDLKADRAATVIQAGLRGYKVRQEYTKLKQKTVGEIATEDETAMEDETAVNEFDDTRTGDDLEDINLKNPDLNKAALKIQAGFRGLKSRKELQKKKELREQEATEKQNVEEAVDLDLTDPELEKAALKIQAGFKGLKTRKDLKKTEEKHEVEVDEEITVPLEEATLDDLQDTLDVDQDDLQDITDANQGDLEDTADSNQVDLEAETAASKIQAHYRGYAARKHLKQGSVYKAEDEEDGGDDDDANFDLTDPKTEQAVVSIQAAFKGYKARKEMQMKVGERKAEVVPTEQDEENDYEFQNAGQENEASMTEYRYRPQDSSQDDLDEKKAAATKIQAGFRGMKSRREVKAVEESRQKAEQTPDETEEAEEAAEQLFEDEPDEM